MTFYKIQKPDQIRSRPEFEYCCPLYYGIPTAPPQRHPADRRRRASKEPSHHNNNNNNNNNIHMRKVLDDLSPNDLSITFGESGRLGIKAKLPALQ